MGRSVSHVAPNWDRIGITLSLGAGAGSDPSRSRFGGDYVGLLGDGSWPLIVVLSFVKIPWWRREGSWPLVANSRTAPNSLEPVPLYIRRITYFMSSLSCVNSILYQPRRILQYLMSYVRKYESLIVTRLRVDGYFGKIPDLLTNVGYFCRVWVSGIASGAQPWFEPPACLV